VPNRHLTHAKYLHSDLGKFAGLGSGHNGRGRGFEPRRPRHTFQMTYGTYGPNVTTKSRFDMGVIGFLPPILRVFFILHFTQIWNHHLHNLALCHSLVRVHRLCVHVKRDAAIGMS
jgi:hypothetical protein